MRRRIVAVGIVVACALVASAKVITDGSLVTTPTINVTPQGSGAMAGSAQFLISTPGTTNVTVDHLGQDPTNCPDPGINVTSTAGFTVMPSVPHTTIVVCPATSFLGMRRCEFHAYDSTNTALTDFMEVCLTWAMQTLTASTSSLTFTNIPVGTLSAPQTVTIKNIGAPLTGTLQLQIDHDLPNDYVVGAPCAMNNNGCDVAGQMLANNGSVDITVYCKPTTTTPPPANLWVSLGGATLPTPIQLSCSGTSSSGAVIDLTTTPSPLDVGQVEVTGGNTASGTVHVQNVGTSVLTIAQNGITIMGAGTDWTYTLAGTCTTLPCDLQPNASTDVTVTLDPSVIGSRTATFQVVSNATSGQSSLQIYGTGKGATLEDLTDPTTIDFGYVPKNGTATAMIHLVNRGNRDLTDVTVSVSPATGFSTSPANPVTVTDTATTTVLLTCSPNGSTSTLMTTFTASAPDTVNNTPVTITATCTGTDAALVASPASIPFGEIRRDRPAPTPKTIELKNVSTQPLMLSGNPELMPGVPALTLTPPSSLSIGANSMQQITLSVSTAADADLTSTITATDDVDSGYTLQIPVTGKVVTPAASVPATLDLGTFCVNQETTASTVVLTSTGTGKFYLPNAPVMMMGGSSPFQLALKAPLTYPALLAPTESASVDIKPKRQAQALPVHDTIEWSTDIMGAPQPTTQVSASFLDDGAAIAPASLDFGQVPVHVQNQDALSVTVQNCSTSALALSGVIDDPAFTFDTTQFPSSLMPGQTATFGVLFEPTKIQHYDGTLTISTVPATQTMLMVKLSGDGIASDGGGDAGPGSGNGLSDTSFYACSCRTSSPVGGLPIVLALGAIILRRRRGSSSAR